MPHRIDITHDAARTSWLSEANGHPEFPLQNLPLGMFSDSRGGPRAGVAIGDSVIDLAALGITGLLGGKLSLQDVWARPNGLIGLPVAQRAALRRALFDLLDSQGSDPEAARSRAGEYLRPMAQCRMELPAEIRSYTDFNAGIYHSARGGMRRGRSMSEALLPITGTCRSRTTGARRASCRPVRSCAALGARACPGRESRRCSRLRASSTSSSSWRSGCAAKPLWGSLCP